MLRPQSSNEEFKPEEIQVRVEGESTPQSSNEEFKLTFAPSGFWKSFGRNHPMRNLNTLKGTTFQELDMPQSSNEEFKQHNFDSFFNIFFSAAIIQ